MPLGTPSNLSLGRLGKIAGGNSNTTSQTSLGATCRGSTGTQTSMWTDFRIGDANSTIIWSAGGGTTGNARGYFRVKVKGDVGQYMGGGSSGEWIKSSLASSLNENRTYYWYISESNVGSKYNDRIVNRSTNSSDYEGGFEVFSGTFGVVPVAHNQPPYDSFKHEEGA